MALGAGFQDAQGQWIFGELDDAGGLASDLLNLAQSRVSAGFAADRTRLTTLDAGSTQSQSPITAAAGYTITNQSAIRVGRLVMLEFRVTRSTTFATADVVGVLLQQFRPSGLTKLGYGIDNGNVAARNCGIEASGNIRLYGAGGRPGTEAQLFTAMYLVAG
jgi:hypothetical protein